MNNEGSSISDDRLISNHIASAGVLNGRLFEVRQRLAAALDRSRGVAPEGDSADPDTPSAGTFDELKRRLRYAHDYVNDIEVQLTELESLI